MRRPRTIILLALALSVSGLVPAPNTRAADARCFAQTGQCIQGRFRAFWEQAGGLAVFGYPISPEQPSRNRDTGQTYVTQWFERERFELHPENAAPYDVLLGRLGDDRLIQTNRNWQDLPKADQGASHYFPQTGHAIAPQFWDYWRGHGLEFGDAGVSTRESLALFGLPLSEPALEKNASGDNVLTQWFERARLEWHPDQQAPYQVLLGLLGTEISAVPAPAPAVSGNLPWLVTAGGSIRTSDGAQVVLHGVNLLRNEWVYPDMTFERKAFPELANNWHANIVTHGFASTPVVQGDPTYLAVLDEYVQLAEQHHMYINLVYYYAQINGEQPPRPDLDPNAKPALVALVQRYRARSNVMFQLQAEPSDYHDDNGNLVKVEWSNLRPIFDDMITAMRAVDNPAPLRHLILAPGSGWGRNISGAVTDPIRADEGRNIVYSTHPYDHQSEWGYFKTAVEAGLPVMITEFGTGSQMTQDDTLALMAYAREHKVSWTAWLFDNEGPPTLLQPGTDRNQFIPSQPYGASVKAEMVATTTPIVPPAAIYLPLVEHPD